MDLEMCSEANRIWLEYVDKWKAPWVGNWIRLGGTHRNVGMWIEKTMTRRAWTSGQNM